MKKFLIIIFTMFLFTSCADKNNISSEQSMLQVTEDSRKILSVGTANGYYDALFGDTLNVPKDIEINFINYLKSDDELALEKAVVSGDVPDILCLPVNDMRKMIDSGMNCIDTVNNTCDFGGAFADLLGFCKNNPIQYDTYISEPDDFLGLNDSELVYTLTINGFNSGFANNTYFSMNKDDITFAGYPSEDGQGAYVTPWRQTLFGISEQCKNKEITWDILCRMLKHHKQLEKSANDDTIGVPTLKDELQKDYNRNKSYANSINTAMFLTDGKEKKYLPTEIKEMLYEYICSAPANPYKKIYDLALIIDE